MHADAAVVRWVVLGGSHSPTRKQPLPARGRGAQPTEAALSIWRKADAVCFDGEPPWLASYGAWTGVRKGRVQSQRSAPLARAVDCTICVQDSLDLLAEFMGVKDEVEKLTNQAMDGSLTLQAALEQRLDIINCTPQVPAFTRCCTRALPWPGRALAAQLRPGCVRPFARPPARPPAGHQALHRRAPAQVPPRAGAVRCTTEHGGCARCALALSLTTLVWPRRAAHPVPPLQGIEELIRVLQARGVAVYLISGGFRCASLLGREHARCVIAWCRPDHPSLPNPCASHAGS